MPELLDRANLYTTQAAKDVNPAYRPLYHAAAPAGWINDPNGMCRFGGYYHLFAQFYPYASLWGPMHWGHWRSLDLVRWDWRGTALAPDQAYDAAGCYSGTALEEDGRLVLAYTGVEELPGKGQHQQQCLAFSTDGERFVKDPRNPILCAGDLPEGASPTDFRDPKILRIPGGYRLLAASRGSTGGQILSFFSQDLQNWRLEGTFLSGIGDMPECPDFFTVDNREVLLSCVMNIPQEGLHFPNTQPPVYILGHTEPGPRFVVEKLEALDMGMDMYAPQTLEAADGRRILLGWMHSWAHESPTHRLGHLWSGAMTLPRELSVENGRLIQRPARELAAYKTARRDYAPTEISQAHTLDGVCAPGAELRLSFSGISARRLEVQVMKAEDEFFSISYDTQSQVLTVDRQHCGYSLSKGGALEKEPFSRALVPLRGDSLDLQIFLDKCSVEVFVNSGETVLSSLAFPGRQGTGFLVTATGGTAQIKGSSWEISG